MNNQQFFITKGLDKKKKKKVGWKEKKKEGDDLLSLPSLKQNTEEGDNSYHCFLYSNTNGRNKRR
jgi:hypothetical protein